MGGYYRFTILGCGSSPGVPRPNGDWGACDPDNPKNHRLRSSFLIERIIGEGAEEKVTRLVIDTGPDFRVQMLKAKATHLDAAVYTHPHADHIHGIDDLRSYALTQKQMMNVYGDSFTIHRLNDAFGYCFQTPKGSPYPPILKAHEIQAYEPFSIEGEGGAIPLMPYRQIHGNIQSLGFRTGNIAYCTDVNAFPEETLPYLMGLDVLVISALQYNSHPSHFSLDDALNWIKRLAPKRAILTHMHIALDYESVRKATPANVLPAYDGLFFTAAL
ncbi:MBL fold metallo-hydrolase [Bartonella sp. DGB2]|uniref:MBL fold metallo-hydrolase n=1 Tax=Bartonella sp. DGB2 TaxID=3388426 RepID=UPI00398FCE7B